jgi:pantetheine-phosphate adenylyltransferase
MVGRTRTALYPGSFDPLTFGHIDVATRAFALADRLVVAIGTHHGKAPRLSAETRGALIEAEIGPLAARAGGTLEVVTFDGLAVDCATAHGATIIVRGLRGFVDFDYETPMAQMNATMAPGVQTVFLAAAPHVGFISSTLVRQVSAMGGDVSAFVPESVRAALGKAPKA